MVQNINTLEEELILALSSYDSLYLNQEHDGWTISGRLKIKGPDKELLDGFDIKIDISNRFPGVVPVVWEVGGRIPRIADRHICTDGSACLFLPNEQEKWFPTKGLTNTAILKNFLDVAVFWFFVAQSYFEREKKWPWGEWQHGILGILEYYFEKYHLTKSKQKKYFFKLFVAKKVKAHWKCFCGSNKELRYCHKEDIEKIRIKPIG